MPSGRFSALSACRASSECPQLIWHGTASFSLMAHARQRSHACSGLHQCPHLCDVELVRVRHQYTLANPEGSPLPGHPGTM